MITKTPNSSLLTYCISFLIISLLTRTALSCYAFLDHQIELHAIELIKLFAFGLVNDLVTFLYFAALLTLIALITPTKSSLRLQNSSCGKVLGYIFLFSFVFAFCLTGFAEFTFWDEFGARFNFIAVDYLVYTREVIHNILESYPINRLVLLLLVITGVIFLLIHKYVHIVISYKIWHSLVIFTLTGLAFFYYDNKITYIPSNNYSSELAKNGVYTLFSAYRNNSLSYEQFYSHLPMKAAIDNVKQSVLLDKQKFVSKDPYDLSRTILSDKPDRNLNVVLITVESLSAEFMKSFGNQHNITPFLDSIADQSLFFTNFFATGTRTVRGLEAISLSIPPTAGSSIVRRPHNEDLFSIATIFGDHHYDNKFLYGGYGYFDNMNHFFKHNGFKVVDRRSIAHEHISFANIWGVADEDLYDQAIREADDSYQKNQKFFQWVMTTTNHRPFTYPDGKIDIASGKGRHGGVKYADYAISAFIKKAQVKPWFNKTIFVITADHCAGSSGKLVINPETYHIPLLIYSPGNIEPKIITKLASQIDLAPTIFGLLNFSYVSKFFGNDIMLSDSNRVFIGSYQLLGLLEQTSTSHQNTTLPQKLDLRGVRFGVLAPMKSQEFWQFDQNANAVKIEEDQDLLRKIISNYQVADYLFQNGYMRRK